MKKISRLSSRTISVHSNLSKGSHFPETPDDDDDDENDNDDSDEDDDDDDDDDDEDDDSDYFDSSGSNSDDFAEWNRKGSEKVHNIVSWVLRKEAFSFDIPKISEKFVDATLMEVNRLLTKKEKASRVRTSEEMTSVVCTDSQSFEQKKPFLPHESYSNLSIFQSIDTTWPKISEFNIKLGLEKLEKYVNTWKRSFDWMFCVEFLGFECEDASNVFVYEVEWSKPTAEYPIPQTTASVYFALEVFKIVPYDHDRNVDVSYVFEGSNVIHYPGKIEFQEKWLDDIMEAKLKFFKSITFSVCIFLWYLYFGSIIHYFESYIQMCLTLFTIQNFYNKTVNDTTNVILYVLVYFRVKRNKRFYKKNVFRKIRI